RDGWRWASAPAGSRPSTRVSAYRWIGPASGSSAWVSSSNSSRRTSAATRSTIAGRTCTSTGSPDGRSPSSARTRPSSSAVGAGRLADIVSINFNNASGRLGSASVAGSTLDVTQEKIGWVRDGAGGRFDEIELEIAAYFVAVRDDPTEAVETMAGRFGVTPEQL